MAHIRMSHGTHINESCHTYEWVRAHYWWAAMPVAMLNQSRHTCKWNMSMHMNIYVYIYMYIYTSRNTSISRSQFSARDSVNCKARVRLECSSCNSVFQNSAFTVNNTFALYSTLSRKQWFGKMSHSLCTWGCNDW